MPTSSVEDIIAQSGEMEENSGEDPLLSLPDVQGLKLSTNSNWENEDGLTVEEEEKKDEENENGTQEHQEEEANENEQQEEVEEEGEEENEKNEGEEEQTEGDNDNDNENENDDDNHAENDEEQSEATQSDSRGGSPPALPSKSLNNTNNNNNNGSTPSRMSYRSRTTPTPNHLSRSPTKSPSTFSPNSSLTSTGLFEFTRAESPGPGAYDILRIPTPNSSTKRHSFSSSLSSRFESTKSISPGPGYYTPPMPKEKNVPRVSMSVPNLRLHNPMFSSSDKTPGPGTYDYDLFCTARRLSSGPSSPFKSVTPRGNLLNGAILKTPGPGFYNPNESLKHSPVTSFTTDNKPAKRSKTSPTLTPGPGAYDPPKPAIPSFTISKKAKTANHVSPLGPGFYDAQKPVKTAPAYSMGVRRPFVVERVLPHNKNKAQDPPLPLTQYPPRQKGAKFSATVYEKPAPKQSQKIPSITASSIQLGMDSNFTVATTAS